MTPPGSQSSAAPKWPLYLIIVWFVLLGLVSLGLLLLGLMFSSEPGGRGTLALVELAAITAPLAMTIILGAAATLLFEQGRRALAYAVTAASAVLIGLFLMLFGL